MTRQSLEALVSFYKAHSLGQLPFTHVIGVLRNTHSILESLEEFIGSFEDFLTSLHNQVWCDGVWEYWQNLYYFRGEIQLYTDGGMPLYDAIEEVIEEYDL